MKASGGRASRAAAALESRPSLTRAQALRTTEAWAVWSLGGRGAVFSRGLASDGGSGQSPSAKAKRAARVLGTCPFPLGKERQRAGRLSSRLRLSTGWVLKEARKVLAAVWAAALNAACSRLEIFRGICS